MIIIVSSKVPPDHSGAGIMNWNFYNSLKSQGYEVKLITTTKVDEADGAFVVGEITPNGALRKINLALNFIWSCFYLFKCFLFYKIKDNNIKSVWLVSTNTLTFSSSIIFWLLGYKIITQNTLVGSDDPAYRYPGDLFNLKYLLKRIQYRVSNTVTSVSPALFSVSQRYHNNCVMIPNPVDVKYQPLQKKSVKRNKVLFVGAIGYRKGIDIVYRTMDAIHKINSSIQFTFVGPNMEKDNSLNELYNGLTNINRENVHFAGFQEDTYPWFADADIFFLPTRREGFGIVFIEAMAIGIPVVAMKLDGITDFIFGDSYSTILTTEDHDQYAQSILKIIDDSAEYNRLVSLGLERVKQFEVKTIYEQYLSIIKA